MINIRMATIADAQALADLAKNTFVDTFSQQNTAENMALHCQSSYSKAIQVKEIEHSKMVTLVAAGNKQLVAYAQLRWFEHPQCVVANMPGEIQRFYVDRAWHGKGIAQQLMLACLKELEERNADVVWLGVWEHNPRAIRFYKKQGFNEVGEQVFPVGTDPQRDIIMARPL